MTSYNEEQFVNRHYKPEEKPIIHKNQLSLIEEFENNMLQSQGIKYIAEYDWDTDDGTWLVWDGTVHHGLGLTESQARKIAAALNEKHERER